MNSKYPHPERIMLDSIALSEPGCRIFYTLPTRSEYRSARKGKCVVVPAKAGQSISGDAYDILYVAMPWKWMKHGARLDCLIEYRHQQYEKWLMRLLEYFLRLEEFNPAGKQAKEQLHRAIQEA